MATPKKDVPNDQALKKEQASPSTPSKLESMSHEDLIKTNRKQLAILQKLKAKYDDVNAKLTTKQSDYTKVKTELNEVENANALISKELNDVKERQEKLLKSKNSVDEELDCLKLKQETLVSSLQCLQEDFNQSLKNKSEISEKLDSVAAEKEEVSNRLLKVENDLQDANNEIKDKHQQLLALKEHIKASRESETNLSNKNLEMEKENLSYKNEIAALKISLDMFKNSKASGDNKEKERLSLTIDKLKSEQAELHSANETLQKQIEDFQHAYNKEKMDLKSALGQCATFSEELAQAKNINLSIEEELARQKQSFADQQTTSALQKKLHEEEMLKVNGDFSNKIVEMEASISMLQDTLDKVQKENSLVQKENSDLKNSLVQVEEKCNGELQQQITDLTDQLAISNKDLDGANKRLEDCQVKICQFENQLFDFQSEKKLLLEGIESKSVELEKISEKSENTAQELLQAKSTIDKLTAESSESMKNNDELRQKIEILEEEKDNLIQTATNSDEERKDESNLQEKCEKIKQEWEKKSVLFVEKIETLTEEKTDLQKQFDFANEKLTKVEQELSDANSAFNLLQQEDAKLQEETKEIKESIANVQKAMAILENENCIKSKNVSELEFKLESSVAKFDALQSRVFNDETSHDDKFKQLNQLISDHEAKAKEFEEKCRELENTLENVKAENMQLLEFKNMKSDEIDTENMDLKKDLSDFKNRCDMLEEKLDITLNEKASKELIEIELKKQIAGMTDELSSSNEKLKAVQVQYNELSSKLSQADATLLEKQTQYNDLNASLLLKDEKIQELSAEMERISNRCADLESEYLAKIAQVEEDKLQACSRIESLQIELEETNSRLSQKCENQVLLTSQQSEKDVLIEELQAKLEELLSAKSNLDSLLKNAKADDEDKANKLIHLEKNLKEKEDLIEKKSNSIKKLQKQVKEINSSLHQSESTHREEIAGYVSKLNDLKTEVAQLGLENSALLNEIENVKCNQQELENSFSLEQSTVKELQDSSENYKNEIKSLIEERNKLKEELRTSNVGETKEDASQSELESLRQSIQEKEVYSSKLKVIAVKARKDLDTAKQQLQEFLKEKTAFQSKISDLNSSLMEKQAQVMSGTQMFQIECDKLQDEIDKIKGEKSNIQKLLDESNAQVVSLNTQNEENSSKLSLRLLDLERNNKEKIEMENQLAFSKTALLKVEKEKENLMKEKSSVQQELDAVKNQLSLVAKTLDEKQELLNSAEGSLANTEEKMKQHDLMSLEMAQYEATLCGLQTQVNDLETAVREKDEKVNDLEKNIMDLNEDRRAIEELRLEAEERVTRTKEALDDARAQVAELSESEHELKGQIDVITEQVEVNREQCEEYKLSLASKSSDCRVLEEKLLSSQAFHQKSTDFLERKIKIEQEELARVKEEKETLEQDFENYKVRAHSVLKQQKNKGVQQTYQPEADAQLVAVKTKLSQLQSKLVETQNVLTSRDQELDLLQGDYDRLLRQQQQSSEGALERETRWKSRMKTLQQELLALRRQHDDVTLKLTQQHDVTAASVARAVERCKSEQEEEVTSLRDDLRRKEEEVTGLRSELKKMDERQGMTLHRLTSSPAHYRPHAMSESHLDYRSVAREAGEGEEHPDDDTVVSLERLLQTPQISSVTELSDNDVAISELPVKQLEAKIIALTKQLEHSTEVARESEATAARLTDQSRVLKEEVRRLEKNQERDKSVANMEYLKNIVYKFLTLPPCDERRHLVPVMDTMLRLSVEEKRNIELLANGGEDSDDQKPSGWGSYLQRWSGMQ